MVWPKILRLGLIVGLPAHGPGKMLGVAERGGAGGDEQLRYLVVVEILPDRHVRRGAERVEEESDFLVFDEAAHLLDCLRRAVAVVEADQIDRPAVDAAHFVDHLEIGHARLADDPVGGGWSAIGHRLPDLYFRIRDAGRIVGARRTGARGQSRRGGARLQERTSRKHDSSSLVLFFPICATLDYSASTAILGRAPPDVRRKAAAHEKRAALWRSAHDQIAE